MTESKPEFDPQLADFAVNPEPRCPCILLLDTSGSMSGAPIDQLNTGLQVFYEGLVKDRLAALRVEVAIITIGKQPVLAQDFVTADQFKPPTLSAGGATPIGAAINLALDTLVVSLYDDVLPPQPAPPALEQQVEHGQERDKQKQG